MISYLLLSALLLSVGMLTYFFLFKERVSANQAKFLICSVLVLSIGIPFFVPGLPNYSKMLSEGRVFHEDYTEWNVVDISDKKLLECYNKAVDSKDICDCEIIQKASKVTFVYNPVYNFFVKYGTYIMYGYYLISALVLLTVLLKLAALIYLVKKSRLKIKDYRGFKFYMLYPYLNSNLPLSAFSLTKNYIIWSPLLSALKQHEFDTVIAHEVAHLRNKDSWFLFALELFKAVFWISPFYFWLLAEFKKQQEFIADEYAANTAGSKRQYAGLLLRLKELQLLNAKAYSISYALSGSLLKKRILRLISPQKSKAKPLRFKFITAIFVLILWIFAYGTLPFIQKQEIKMKQYEILAISHSQ